MNSVFAVTKFLKYFVFIVCTHKCFYNFLYHGLFVFVQDLIFIIYKLLFSLREFLRPSTPCTLHCGHMSIATQNSSHQASRGLYTSMCIIILFFTEYSTFIDNICILLLLNKSHTLETTISSYAYQFMTL